MSEQIATGGEIKNERTEWTNVGSWLASAASRRTGCVNMRKAPRMDRHVAT